jgi:elongation factor 1-alpha
MDSWYKGGTLVDALDSLSTPKRFDDRPLRIAIHDMYMVGGVGTVVVGRIASGILKQYHVLTTGPNNFTFANRTVEV